MAVTPAPIPTRTYTFVAGQPAVGDQVNHELDTVYGVLQGAVGDVHIADQANINGSKLLANSIPAAQIKAEAWTTWVPSYGGFSVNPTVSVARYIQIGKIIFATLYHSAAGTSSTSGFTVTLPVAAKSQAIYTGGDCKDNSVQQTAPCLLFTIASSTTVSILRSDLSNWTPSGFKGANFTIVYEAV